MNRTAVAILAVVAVVAAVYHRAMDGYFFEDDFQWLAGTLTYDPRSIFSLEGRTHFYRPVIELYFWAGTPLFDGSPALFHLASVALHAINGVLLFLIARRISGSEAIAVAAALFFVAMPGYVEAVAWVGALAEPVSAAFGCSSVFALLAWRRSGRRAWLAASVLGFLGALLTHESSAVFLPILVLADWAADPSRRLLPRTRREWLAAAAVYGLFAAAFALYLVPDLFINQQSYLVSEGYYRVGPHMVTNALDYVVSLYVGKKGLASYVAIVLVLAWLLARGSRRVRFAVAWLVLGMLPFLPFTWGNASRYLYLPAMGFALLLAEGVGWLDGRLARRPVAASWRRAIVALIVVAVSARYAAFCRKGVSNFVARTDAYRQFARQIKEAHPRLAPYDVVFIDARDEARLHHRYLEALIRWEYRDPTIQVVTRPAAGS